MDNKGFAFITCVSDEEIYRECLRCLAGLKVPPGYTVECLAVRGAPSMTRGYNRAMERCGAQYKIYLHQDTFIVNPTFLYDLLTLFSADDRIGAVGVAGAEQLPPSGIWWEAANRFGQVAESSSGRMSVLRFRQPGSEYQSVAAVDGLLMATRADLPWREDLLDGWHFYDQSQCLELKRAGYLVAVPDQKECWCVHDCGPVRLENGYEAYRRRFVEMYGNLPDVWEAVPKRAGEENTQTEEGRRAL